MQKIFISMFFAPLVLLSMLSVGKTAPEQTRTEAPAYAAPAHHSIAFRGATFTEGETITGELTHYCAGSCCNGEWAGTTADGTVLNDDTPPIAGCNWLPMGSIVTVDGVLHRIADRSRCKHCEAGLPGSCDTELCEVGRLDVFTPEGHQAALDKGRMAGVEVRIISLP